MTRATTRFRNKRQPRGRSPRPEMEDAAPRDRGRVYPSDIARTRAQSGPVRTWAEMTPEERARVVADLGARTAKP